jgi:hypothetical protein
MKNYMRFWAGNTQATLVSTVALNTIVTRNIPPPLPDKSDVTDATRKGQSSNLVKRARTITRCVHFGTVFVFIKLGITASQDTSRYVLYFPFPH